MARVWECSLTWPVLEWKFPVVPEIALELLMTENFLNYYVKNYNEILAFQYLIPVGELVSFSYVVCCM